MTPSSCGNQHAIHHAGRAVTLACSIDAGHDGSHQCYWRDRLHEWP
jgi:hypothetical protein